MIAPGRRNLITDVPGLRVGNASDPRLKSGTTVLTADAPFVADADEGSDGRGPVEGRVGRRGEGAPVLRPVGGAAPGTPLAGLGPEHPLGLWCRQSVAGDHHQVIMDPDPTTREELAG